jgi:hypothetical protein
MDKLSRFLISSFILLAGTSSRSLSLVAVGSSFPLYFQVPVSAIFGALKIEYPK